MINVVSVRVGSKYGPEYIHKLHDGICRHLGEDQAHWCVTDDPDGLPEGVTAIPHNPDLPGWWQKLALFDAERMPWALGDSILYMDLDVCVTGRLEGLPEGIIKDWHWPTYNSSVMHWRHGDHAAIWDRFGPEIIDRPTDILQGLLPNGQVNGGDQEWISHVSAWSTFPPEYFVSYRDAVDWPPECCKAVIFHGKPKPSDITEGWVPGVWKVGGFTAPPKLDGMNVSSDFAYGNIRANVGRDLEWFCGREKLKGSCVIVGGGPSLKDSLPAIRAHRMRGSRIVTVNNALKVLTDAGIRVDSHVMLDAREENVAFVENAPKNVRYLLASQVHPCVFDALSGHDVVMWHNGMHDGEELWSIVQPWEETKPIIFVPGGGTVGLRALSLAWLSGYKKIHLYGFDSSYAGDKHHAYPQALNDGDSTRIVALGEKTYRCAPWMIRQAMEFQDQFKELSALGVKVVVHGQGLIPDIYRNLTN